MLKPPIKPTLDKPASPALVAKLDKLTALWNEYHRLRREVELELVHESKKEQLRAQAAPRMSMRMEQHRPNAPRVKHASSQTGRKASWMKALFGED